MTNVFVEISLQIDNADRPEFKLIYDKYRSIFMASVPGAQSKRLLIRDEDVQVLLGFDTADHASNYLSGKLFSIDVVNELKPLLKGTPEVKIYAVSA